MRIGCSGNVQKLMRVTTTAVQELYSCHRRLSAAPKSQSMIETHRQRNPLLPLDESVPAVERPVLHDCWWWAASRSLRCQTGSSLGA